MNLIRAIQNVVKQPSLFHHVSKADMSQAAEENFKASCEGLIPYRSEVYGRYPTALTDYILSMIGNDIENFSGTLDSSMDLIETKGLRCQLTKENPRRLRLALFFRRH